MRLDQLLTGDRIFTADDLYDDVVMDCVDPSRRNLVALGEHMLLNDPGSLSADARKTVLVLREWAEESGSNLTDDPYALLMMSISPSLNTNVASDELVETYGRGDWGATGFHAAMNALLEADPAATLPADAMDYIDTALADGWADAEQDGGTDMADWPAAHEEIYAVYDIAYFSRFDGFQVDNDAAYISAPLACANTNTLQSQPRTSYAHFVDFAEGAWSVMPLGQSEHRGDTLLSQAEIWESGEMKPAPLDADDIAALTVDTDTISYLP
jgi:hypothetical protein